MIEKPRRHRCRHHLRHVRSFCCLACKAPPPSQAHHLTFVQPKARGLKAGDQWAVPMCDRCHRALHHRGDERAYWGAREIDPVRVAEALWAETKAGGDTALEEPCPTSSTEPSPALPARQPVPSPSPPTTT